MSDEYTPTTVRVRNAASRYWTLTPIHQTALYLEEMRIHAEDFDRWLAEHDRQVAEAAWDSGYDVGYDDSFDGGTGLTNPHRVSP